MRNDFTEDLDDDFEDEQEETSGIAKNATVPQAAPDMIDVPIGAGEKLNLSLRAFDLMDENKVKTKEASKLRKAIKANQEEIDKIATWVRTGVKQVPNGEQQNLLEQAVGPEAAAAAFEDLGKSAEAALAATGGQAGAPAEWQPQNHKDGCPAKQGPLHACSCGWNKAHGGPVAEEPFETSPAELEKQSGRKKGKKA